MRHESTMHPFWIWLSGFVTGVFSLVAVVWLKEISGPDDDDFDAQ